jgi:hypothetical protein
VGRDARAAVTAHAAFPARWTAWGSG